MIARDPHARYLTPPRLDDPLRAGVSKIWTGERVGRKEGRGRFRGRNDRLEICVAILTRRLLRGAARRARGENILRRGMKYRVM